MDAIGSMSLAGLVVAALFTAVIKRPSFAKQAVFAIAAGIGALAAIGAFGSTEITALFFGSMFGFCIIALGCLFFKKTA